MTAAGSRPFVAAENRWPARCFFQGDAQKASARNRWAGLSCHESRSASPTHSRRWHLVHNTVGSGTIYQGRFKAIPVKDDVHFLTVCRYVERNPVRARLVRRVEEWDWSSASCQWHLSGPRLRPWPVPRPASWEEDANAEEDLADLLQLRDAIGRNVPFGSESWRDQTISSLGWQTGLRPRGRPHLRPEDRKI